MPANNKPVITAKAAAKQRRNRRNAKRKATWTGALHKADLKKVSLMKQALKSIEGFFGTGQQGGTYVFIHVSKLPGTRKGQGHTRYNPVKRARRLEREHEKRRKKKQRQILDAKQRMGDAPLPANAVIVLPQAA